MGNLSFPEQLVQCTAKGLKPGIALGVFGLIHAGTIEFLRHARKECDRLFVAILPVPSNSVASDKTSALLRPEERVRILSAFVEVEAAGLVEETGNPSLKALCEAAPQAVWFSSKAENDVDEATADRLGKLGSPLQVSTPHASCTTAALLERMVRGK